MRNGLLWLRVERRRGGRAEIKESIVIATIRNTKCERDGMGWGGWCEV